MSTVVLARTVLLTLWSNVRGVMRELSDESAYERHLGRHHAKHSAEEYRRFAEHRLAAKYTRAKCC